MSLVESGVHPPSLPESRRRIGDVLVEHGVLTVAQLDDSLAQQRDCRPDGRRRRLGDLVVVLGLATEEQVTEALATVLGLQQVDLTRVVVDPVAVRLLPQAVAQRSGVVVLGRVERRLEIAAIDPTNVVALDDVRLYTGYSELAVRVATPSSVRTALQRVWAMDSAQASSMFLDVEADAEPDPEEGLTDSPAVRLVDVLFADAARAGASDVHVEPRPDGLRIRFRVDGMLRDVMTVPRSGASAMVSRLKIVAGMDISERRRPQDGRSSFSVDGRQYDARVSTLPALHGEKVVARLVAPHADIPRLAQLGMTQAQLDVVMPLLLLSQGLVLLTGPTGSGKTATLYAALAQLNGTERNIVTLEDPPELEIPGITQVQVNHKAGLDFARGLRSVLRQDPDVVLVGEARDTETAELALRASLTGHLVLTTLHTNDTVSALTRLSDMGVPSYLVASSLTLVVAQRLVRRPCAGCAQPYEPSERVMAQLGLVPADLVGATPRRGRGCGRCNATGYHGRRGVFEVLPVTTTVRRVLLDGASESALRAAARSAGVMSLRAAALAAAALGETTYEEVLRVTAGDRHDGAACAGCSRAVDPTMAACPWCGTATGAGVCSGCSTRLESDWRFCPACRQPVGDGPRPVVEPPAAAAPRLLVVDDDASVRSLVEIALSPTFEVVTAADGAQALARAAEGVDVVLVDNVLPDLTGTELVRLLRADPRTAHAGIVLFSGYSHDGLESDARLAGADDFLVKPVDPVTLEERMLQVAATTGVRAG